MTWLAIAFGGAAGALLRYTIGFLVQGGIGAPFPWGTLVVNMIGSFLMGFLWHLFELLNLPTNVRALVLTGGLGAFTTFSTFSLEALNLFKGAQFMQGVLYMGASTLLGLLFVYFGFVLAAQIR